MHLLKKNGFKVVLLLSNTLLLLAYWFAVPFVMNTYGVGMCQSIFEPYYSLAIGIMLFIGLWLIFSMMGLNLIGEKLIVKAFNNRVFIWLKRMADGMFALTLITLMLVTMLLWVVYVMMTQVFVLGCVV